MAWKNLFKQGIGFFKRGKYEDALNKFNQAVRENDKERSLYDSRAAVFEKLDRPLDALEDSKKVIDLAPDSWQGYARSARLYLQIKKPEASLKMAELAIERVKITDKKRRAELESLKQKVLKDMERPPCFFNKMPVEICSEIFLTADKSSVKMLALTLVCRRWREIILGMPSLWRKLTLTPKTPTKKVDAWLQRSRGTLSSLELQEGFAFNDRRNILRHASKHFWSKLETLKVHISPEITNLSQVLPPGAFCQLRLRELKLDLHRIYTPVYPPGLWDSLDNMDVSRMEKLVICSKAGFTILPHLHPFTTLTTLGVYVYEPVDKILPVLERNPLLETLDLSTCSYEPINTLVFSEDIKLLNLRRFKFSVFLNHDTLFRRLRFPNLEELSMARLSRSGFDILTTQPLPRLRYLRLERCEVTPTALISLLQASTLLERFELPHCTPTESANAIVAALAEPLPNASDGSPAGPATICCPRLQHLDFSSTTHLKAGPVVRLVEAHLPPVDVPLEGEPAAISQPPPPLPLPIRTLRLVLNGCEALDAEVLLWLRTKVAQVNCEMTQKRRPGLRR